MFNALFAAFKSAFGLNHMTSVMSHLEQIVSLLEADYVKDGNARDAAIDALCEILQQHKNNPPASKV